MSHETITHLSVDGATGMHDDHRLAERASAGDEGAIVMIMRRYNQQLYRLAVAIVCDKFDAEDVLQEAYIRAFGRIADYAGEGRLGSWLASIVRHEAIDRVRVRNRRSEHVAIEADMRRPLSDDNLPLNRACADEAFSNPEIQVERNDIRRLLEREISQLPEQFRAVFMLREVEELTVEETAEYLGIAEATVKSRDFRARAMLKARLGEQIDASMPQTFTFLNQACDSMVERVMNRLANKQ
jgi:RNA polymerase sigma-70 factor, ECF subfamily